jgi:catechol 2,3-dioxygenase-like lactoylglutathione lyase family enzyme
VNPHIVHANRYRTVLDAELATFLMQMPEPARDRIPDIPATAVNRPFPGAGHLPIITKMLNKARIEARIPTRDLARARRWYAEKLGLEPVEERDGGLRYEGASGVFCLFSSTGTSDGSFTQLGFYVDDIEATVAALRARGVVFEDYGGSVDGIVDIEGNYPSKGRGERAAWFRDCEGNMLGVAEVVR